MMIKDVLKNTGITATAGIGTNLYLAKIAMDIVAKHKKADENGVRIAQLDEQSYRELLWNHEPITDFWRVGRGYSNRLEKHGIYTMGDIARCSLGGKGDYYNEDLLYKLFGINAELLIDHAWGVEPCTIADIKAYKPASSSLCSGQVLQEPYDSQKARLVVSEMADLLSGDLLSKGLVTNQMTLTIGYDTVNCTDSKTKYKGETVVDQYGRKIPKHSHGTWNFDSYTLSSRQMVYGIKQLYDKIVNKDLLIRRLNISVNNLIKEEAAKNKDPLKQMSMFDMLKDMELSGSDKTVKSRKDNSKTEEGGNNKTCSNPLSEDDLKADREIQKAVMEIKKKFGKNAVLKGMNLEEGATAMTKNKEIGGHKA